MKQERRRLIEASKKNQEESEITETKEENKENQDQEWKKKIV